MLKNHVQYLPAGKEYEEKGGNVLVPLDFTGRVKLKSDNPIIRKREIGYDKNNWYSQYTETHHKVNIRLLNQVDSNAFVELCVYKNRFKDNYWETAFHVIHLSYHIHHCLVNKNE